MVIQQKALRFMSQKTPKVGIALAAYLPSDAFFEEQLLSIQKQSYQNWVCVISFDSRPATVPEWVKSDSRFTIVENPNPNGHMNNFLFACQNLLRLHHETKFIAFSDQDDVWLDSKIELMVEAAQATDVEALLIHSDLILYRGGKADGESVWQFEGRKTDDHDPGHLLIRNLATGASMMISASLYQRFKDIPLEFKDHDHWFALMASIYGRIIAVDEPLVLYRQHGNNQIGAHEAPGLFKLRKKWSISALIAHCVHEFNTYQSKTLSLPDQLAANRGWLKPSFIIRTLIEAGLVRDQPLFRRTLLIFFGRMLHWINPRFSS